MIPLQTLKNLKIRYILFLLLIMFIVTQFILRPLHVAVFWVELYGFFLIPLLYYFWNQWKQKRPFLEVCKMEIRLPLPRFFFLSVGIIFLGLLLNICVLIFLNLMTRNPEASETTSRILQQPDLVSLTLIWGVYCILGPCAEELFFRGILFVRLQRKLSSRVSIWLVSLLFGLGHILFLSPFVFSVLAFKINRYTGSLRYSVIIHICNNLLYFLGGLLVYFQWFTLEEGDVASSPSEDLVLLLFLVVISMVLFSTLWRMIPERDEHLE